LLIQRRHPPNQGTWTFPGGRVERGESLVEAVRREVMEETRMAVNVGDLVEVFEVIPPPGSLGVDAKYHYVILDYVAVPVTPGQIPAAGDDAMDARFAPLNVLAPYALTDAVLRVIEKAYVKIT